MFNFQASCALVALMVVSACGGGAVDPESAPTFDDFLNDFDQSSSAIRSDDFSSASSVSGAGGTYTGKSLLRVVNGSGEVFLLGDATLTANIGAGTVSGTLENFVDSEAENLSGAFTVVGQSIGNAQDSEFESTVSGALTGATTSVSFGPAPIFGDFYSDPTQHLFASGVISNTTLNGTAGLTSTLEIQADKD